MTVPNACTGSVIGKGGGKIKSIIAKHDVKVQTPKRGAPQTFKITGTNQVAVNAAAADIEEIRDSWLKRDAKHQAHQLRQEQREKKRQSDWSRHIQKESGCEGDDWKTAGSASAWQHKNRSRGNEAKVQPRVAKKNRFELPDDSEEEDTDGPTVWAPEEPIGSWGKGMPKLKWGDKDATDTVSSSAANEGGWGDIAVNGDIKWIAAAPVTQHTAAKTPATNWDLECPSSPECKTSGGGFESAEMDDAGW